MAPPRRCWRERCRRRCLVFLRTGASTSEPPMSTPVPRRSSRSAAACSSSRSTSRSAEWPSSPIRRARCSTSSRWPPPTTDQPWSVVAADDGGAHCQRRHGATVRDIGNERLERRHFLQRVAVRHPVVFDHDVNETDAILQAKDVVCEALRPAGGEIGEDRFYQLLVLVGPVRLGLITHHR